MGEPLKIRYLEPLDCEEGPLEGAGSEGVI